MRLRNIYPADFKQDQFTTRLDYNLLKGDSQGNTKRIDRGGCAGSLSRF